MPFVRRRRLCKLARAHWIAVWWLNLLSLLIADWLFRLVTALPHNPPLFHGDSAVPLPACSYDAQIWRLSSLSRMLGKTPTLYRSSRPCWISGEDYQITSVERAAPIDFSQKISSDERYVGGG